MKTKVYTKREIIDTIVSVQLDSDMLADTIPQDLRDQIFARIKAGTEKEIERMMNFDDTDLIKEFKKHNLKSNLRVFAPGLYFISNDITNYSFQVL